MMSLHVYTSDIDFFLMSFRFSGENEKKRQTPGSDMDDDHED